MDPKQPHIKCNPFPSFMELKHEGKSVLQPPARFIKSLVKTLTMDHIGDVKDRKDRGRSARTRNLFYPSAWRINELAMEELRFTRIKNCAPTFSLRPKMNFGMLRFV
jgi:hypothetical protein